jgi:diguanylate cyclase (GGDEF)-like protein
MTTPPDTDIHSDTATERLLEESWESRSRGVSRRELATEAAAGGLFVIAAAGLLLLGGIEGFDAVTAAMLVALYAVVARVEFPVGAGYVVPTQLVLVPMLVLLPPETVPPLVAAGLVLARTIDWVRHRGSPLRLLFSVADAWHAVGPALVLLAAGAPQLDLGTLPLLGVAVASSFLFDAGSAMGREAAARGIAPDLQLRVLGLVCLVDACLVPIGFLAARGAEHGRLAVLLVLPLAGLLGILARDHHARIETAQSRLRLAEHERARLQSAVRRMGDAFAAKLDLDALLDIVLRGSVEALDADAGVLEIGGAAPVRAPHDAPADLRAALDAAAAAAADAGRAEQVRHAAGWALALPFAVDGAGEGLSAVAIARRGRRFQDDEVALLTELVAKGRSAAADIVGHQRLRRQAVSDPLTGLGNRRKLAEDMTVRLADAGPTAPHLLMLFDLDGFKAYNDTFGHPAGDALLAHLGTKLAAAAASSGAAYRIGGDEFCAVLSLDEHHLEEALAAAVEALTERGEEFAIAPSYGVVLLPHEAETLEQALQLADERMYAHKRGRSSARQQARDVLMHTLEAKQPTLGDHSSGVAELAIAVARRLRLSAEEVDEVARAAELHDVGKVGIPDAILDKPGPLDAVEWELMHQHTIVGERILNAAPALRPVAKLVRASHERWDGTGYPDGLRGEEIPRGARIVAVCDAYEAMTADRAYRRALSHEAACAELHASAGTQFDPEAVAAFIAAVRSCNRAETSEDGAGAGVELVAERVRSLLTAG